MRLPKNIVALSPSLLLWILSLLLSHADASSLHSTSQLPLQVPQPVSREGNRRSWFSRTRNSVIQSIWRIPNDNALCKANDRDSKTSGPPPTVLARYGGDLVLRFEIKSIEEAEALAEAVTVLFLDVWEFTTDWVDIRLSKDVVSLSCFRLHMWLLTCVIPGPVTAGTFAVLPSACSHAADARPRPGDL